MWAKKMSPGLSGQMRCRKGEEEKEEEKKKEEKEKFPLCVKA